jgi:hypothetical protein
MKRLELITILCFLLASCAEALPAVATSLEALKHVYAELCVKRAPIEVEAAVQCEKAKTEINTAIDLYTEINQ